MGIFNDRREHPGSGLADIIHEKRLAGYGKAGPLPDELRKPAEDDFNRYIPKYDGPQATARQKAEEAEDTISKARAAQRSSTSAARREERIQARMSGASEEEISQMHKPVPKAARVAAGMADPKPKRQADPVREAMRTAARLRSLSNKARGRRR